MSDKTGTRVIEVDYLARVEGEGALYVRTEGGRVVCAGTPEQVVAADTHTGRALAPVLAR